MVKSRATRDAYDVHGVRSPAAAMVDRGCPRGPKNCHFDCFFRPFCSPVLEIEIKSCTQLYTLADLFSFVCFEITRRSFYLLVSSLVSARAENAKSGEYGVSLRLGDCKIELRFV